MKECKNEDELMDAIKNWVWYDEQGDAQISYDIALEAIQQALNIPDVSNNEVAVCDCDNKKYYQVNICKGCNKPLTKELQP